MFNNKNEMAFSSMKLLINLKKNDKINSQNLNDSTLSIFFIDLSLQLIRCGNPKRNPSTGFKG